MKRVFRVDVLQRETCGGAMKILAAIHPPDTIQRILSGSDCPLVLHRTRRLGRDPPNRLILSPEPTH